MKNLAITIFIVLLIAVMGLYLVSFQVRETESALVMRFGEPIHQITEPGLRFKLPTPIERVYKFDSRLRVFQPNPVETTTKGAVPIIVNTYVVWKIAEPLQFFNANAGGSVRDAEDKLDSQVRNTQNSVIGRHFFSEFVNNDPARIRFREIEEEMLAELQQSVLDADYGISIKKLGMKRLKVSEEVTKAVFDRMRAERERKTIGTIAEGSAEAKRIRNDAILKETGLLAVAQARATVIRGRGDAEAAKYYKMLEADPALAMFLRNTQALKKILAERSTYIVPTDVEPFTLLRKIPDIKPGESNK